MRVFRDFALCKCKPFISETNKLTQFTPKLPGHALTVLKSQFHEITARVLTNHMLREGVSGNDFTSVGMLSILRNYAHAADFRELNPMFLNFTLYKYGERDSVVSLSTT